MNVMLKLLIKPVKANFGARASLTWQPLTQLRTFRRQTRESENELIGRHEKRKFYLQVYTGK